MIRGWQGVCLGEGMMTPFNPDDMTTIVDPANVDGCITPEECAELKAEFKHIAATFTDLASYAEAKENAMILRGRGEIEKAQRFEVAADTVYARLPQWAKW